MHVAGFGRHSTRAPCKDSKTDHNVCMSLVWVTGNSGVGKSAVCKELQSRGLVAVDADWDGYNSWINRFSGEVVLDPPYPVPAGWLDDYAWRTSRTKVEMLAARARKELIFLCGSSENEAEICDLFDLVICLCIDEQTLRTRLMSRTTNAFGQHPEELAAALKDNEDSEAKYKSLGATVIDATMPLAHVTDTVISSAHSKSV
jgi:uridine kinase